MAAQVAVDGAGAATAIWTQMTGELHRVQAARFVPETGWGPATPLDAAATAAAQYPQVVHDAAGNVTTAWSEVDGTIWARRHEVGGGWGDAVLVETDDAGDACCVQLAVGPDETAIMTWYGGESSWASRFEPGGGWSIAEPFGVDGPSGNPQLAVDASGRITVVWGQWDGSRDNVWAMQREAEVWSEPVLVELDDTATAFNPQVASAPSGAATVVWQQYDDATELGTVWGNRHEPGVGWGQAILLASDAGYPQIASDDAGAAVAVWTMAGDDETVVGAARFAPGAGWSEPATIGVGGGDPQIAVAPSGEAIAVWYDTDGATAHIWFNTYR